MLFCDNIIFPKKDRGDYSTNTVGMSFMCLKKVMKLFYAAIKQVAEEQSRTWRGTFFSVQTHIKLLAEEGRGL